MKHNELTVYLNLRDIVVGERFGRIGGQLDEGNVASIFASLTKPSDLINPILVARLGDKYELVAGGHRLEAFSRKALQGAKEFETIRCTLVDTTGQSPEMARNTIDLSEVKENLCRQNLDSGVERAYAARYLELTNARREIEDREAREKAKQEAEKQAKEAREQVAKAKTAEEKKAALDAVKAAEHKAEIDRQALTRNPSKSAIHVANTLGLTTKRRRIVDNSTEDDDFTDDWVDEPTRLRRGVLAKTSVEVRRTESYLRSSNEDAKLFGGAKSFGTIATRWAATISAQNASVKSLMEVAALRSLLKADPAKGKACQEAWIAWAAAPTKIAPRRPSEVLGAIGGDKQSAVDIALATGTNELAVYQYIAKEVAAVQKAVHDKLLSKAPLKGAKSTFARFPEVQKVYDLLLDMQRRANQALDVHKQKPTGKEGKYTVAAMTPKKK